MTRLQRLGVMVVCLAVAGGSLWPTLQRGRAAAPPGAAPGSAGVESKMDALLEKLNGTQEKVAMLMPSMKLLADANFRAGDGKKVLPLMKEAIGYWKDLEKTAPSENTREIVRENKYRFMAMASVLGDADTMKELDAAATGASKSDVVSAKTALLFNQWLLASTDATAQGKILDDYASVAKANADNDEVAITLGFIANVGAANSDTSHQVIDILHNLTGDAAKAIAKQLDLDELKLHMVGHPLVLAGDTPGGGTFSTESLKGKVVLIDFWATWCPPCVASLPELKAIYNAHHAEGFEVMGVSSDDSSEALTKFTADNNMPWPELWDKTLETAKPPLHPINRKYGFNAIPAAIILDKQGVVRYMRYFDSTSEGTVRRDLGDRASLSLEDQVKALLAEKPGDAPAAPAATPPAK